MNNTENNQPLSILETAEELFDCGFQVLSVKKDGTKRPAVGTDWPNYQTSAADIEKWYGGKHPRVGMGIITGEPSGDCLLYTSPSPRDRG